MAPGVYRDDGRIKFNLIQCFRAIAILFVLLGHVSGLFHRYFDYDWFHISEWRRTGGVDFFFVLSGFMIAYLYSRSAGVPGKAISFLIKRLKRIYPLYFLVTFMAVMLLYLFPMLGEEQERHPLVIIKSLLLWPSEPILSVTWSLQYIAFFYIMYALYLAKPKLMKIAAAVWTGLVLLMEIGAVPVLNDYLFSFSMIEILAGCLAAYLFLRFKWERIWLLITGAGILGYFAVWTNNVYSMVEIYEPYFYCVFSFLIMLGIAAADRKKVRRSPKVLLYLGSASYSIYIAHGPIAQLYILLWRKLGLDEMFGHFVSLCAVIILTVLSSCLVYEHVEKRLAAAVREGRGSRIQLLRVKKKVS
ncbi:acyltransferase family protein [Fictibacillus aquaticus]|uniref:Acyltransferase 3 domain-containing protein n=1 Tax=Fictibacillus aquaticus TaxID=2021314 RepID=A0A235F9M3_9BACL|nr:acyltransferase [Fictibacillus aquaticus]OYD57723.1 hypothetical protein CGZ90_13750 [Fictibacillus aquaticus]